MIKETLFHQVRKLVFIGTCILSLSFCGCGQDEGPMEKAGKKTDNALEETREKTGEAIEDTGDALKEAGDDIDDRVEKNTDNQY